MTDYQIMQQKMSTGWNTFNTRSYMSHVVLPHGFAINLGIKDYWKPQYLKEALMKGPMDATCRPALRSYDGSYTDIRVLWRDIDLRVQSAIIGDDVVILATPLHDLSRHVILVAESGILWNYPGYISRDDNSIITGHFSSGQIKLYSSNAQVDEIYIQTQTPFYAVALDGPAGFSTQTHRTLDQITSIINDAEAKTHKTMEHFGAQKEVATAIQTCIAWNTVFDPINKRVITPISRDWSTDMFGGYALFGWDTFFASMLASVGSRELAYANAIEMTREITDAGFIPNWGGGTGAKMNDRSMPQVGATMVREVYRRFRDKWFLAEVFDALLSNNRWYAKNRTIQGYICLGSQSFTPIVKTWEETNGQGKILGAKFELGLDNSPMYDDTPFDEKTGMMQQADVGQMSLHIADCEALSEIAAILGKLAEAQELLQRADFYQSKLNDLWDDKAGIYKNKVLTDGTLSNRISPTSFFPLLCNNAATPAQVERLVNDHLLNEQEFWGEWVIPTIARNDPAYPEQKYWRGKIWAPINFLVYLCLRRNGSTTVASMLAEKSSRLFLREWCEKGHVHENYSADTGLGCDRAIDSDAFHQWGGLLGLIPLMEHGFVEGPEGELQQIKR